MQLSLSVCDNIIHEIQKVETMQMSISWWICKQNWKYIYNRITFTFLKTEVLGVVVTTYLVKHLPGKQEEVLSSIRSIT